MGQSGPEIKEFTEALVDVQQAQMLLVALPAIDQILVKMEKEVDRKAQSCQNQNELTPERALSFYMERLAVQKLRTRIDQIVRVGTSSGEQISEKMKIGGDDG